MLAKVSGDWGLPSLWALRYRRIRGRPLQFFSKVDPTKHRPWAVSILNDPSRNIVVKKARQAGITEVMGCLKMIHFASLVMSTTIYSLPTDPKAREISNQRFKPLGTVGGPSAYSEGVIENLIDWNKTVTTKTIRPRYGGGFSSILFTGSWNERLGESTAADAIYLDEYDRMRPGVIAAFRKSLSASVFGLLRVFSTPTFPGQGVDGVYLQSDRKRYFWRCSACGRKEYLTRKNIIQKKGPISLIQRLEQHDISAKIVRGTFEIGCSACFAKIDRLTIGEWVPESSEDTEYSGYSFSQLDCPWISGDSIMRDLRDMKPGLGPWHNYDLGEAYLGDGANIPEGFTFTLVNPEIPRFDNVSWFKSNPRYSDIKTFLGVDWGKTNWAVVLGVSRDFSVPCVLAIESFTDNPADADDTWKWVLELVKRWECSACIADVGYGQDRNPKLYRALGRKFYACQYPTTRSTTQRPLTVEPHFGNNPCLPNQSTSVVVIDRDASLEEKLAFLKNHRYQLASLDSDRLEVFDAHCRGIIMSVEEDQHGVLHRVANAVAADHYLHALNYAQIALEAAKRNNQFFSEIDTAVSQEDLIRAEIESIRNGVNSGMPTGDDLSWLTTYLL